MRSFSLDSDNSDVPRKTVANWDDSVSHPTRLKPIVNSNNHTNDNEDSIVVEWLVMTHFMVFRFRCPNRY